MKDEGVITAQENFARLVGTERRTVRCARGCCLPSGSDFRLHPSAFILPPSSFPYDSLATS
jgi:hypothetical protein